MPYYAYRCLTCGAFDSATGVDDAGDPKPCPECGQPASRVYTMPSFRSPRRARELDRMGASDVRRLERTIEGAPTVGPMPPGRRMTGDRPPVRHSPTRPWTMGH